MSCVTLIFPHQLFREHPALLRDRNVYLVEEWLFFKQVNFHKQKLLFHRASMKEYEQYLANLHFSITYIQSTDERNDVRNLIDHLHQQKVTEIHLVDVVDFLLFKRIKIASEKYAMKVIVYDSPSFILSNKDIFAYQNKRKSYFQTDFYTQQRKLQNVLMENDGKPTGGKWTFDDENRARFPKKEVPPHVHFPEVNAHILEAKKYVETNFATNYGEIQAPYFFATNFKDADAWLADFLQNRFEKFGLYEDAIVANEYILHHSVISPMLNAGILEPKNILHQCQAFAEKNQIPLNSLEGFMRQIMGWREFIRLVYEREGVLQRTKNYWQFKRKIPSTFWTGTTGIEPIDITIKKVLETGYCHHIERLMVLGNFMLLCEFDPDEVHKWFMEMFIDAYDWVMVPNVYGMTQFADGGIMTTKPYISGSNYLMKMSDYPKGEWQGIWDGLFWRFMHVHRDFFLQNPRLGMLIGTFDKMNEEKRNLHLANAENYLAQL